MWIKKVFASVWIRGIVASFTPPLGMIGLIFLLSKSQITVNIELIFLALSLSLLHFLINLILPFAVSWMKAILAAVPINSLVFSLVVFNAFAVLAGSAIYGSETMQRTFRESLLLIFQSLLFFFLATPVCIIFARLGAGLGISHKKNTKS